VIGNSKNNPLTIYSGSDPTLRYLLYPLIAGAAIVLPSLIYLLKIFKVRVREELYRNSA